jgi:hypothetical protein
MAHSDSHGIHRWSWRRLSLPEAYPMTVGVAGPAYTLIMFAVVAR